MSLFRHDVLIIIPARHAASRFPGKPLALLQGADGVARPLIEHSWRAAMALADIADVLVATDHRRIEAAVANFGAACVMTSPEARNGTERCAEAVAATGASPSLVINLQGDSPVVARAHVEALIRRWREGGDAAVLTPMIRCTPTVRAHLEEEISAGRPSGVFAVGDETGNALTFSRKPPSAASAEWYLHVGVYAYEPRALARYVGWPPGELEKAESLEQLRFLENGEPVTLVAVDPAPGGYADVNYPTDIAGVEALLRQRAA